MHKIWIGLLIVSGPAAACTLWGAAGDAVEGGGTLLAKNRDWRPDHTQSIRILTPKQGFRYVGLFADDGAEPGIKAGVNEQGLAVVSAAASSIPKKIRNAQTDVRGVMSKILRQYGSVAEVMADAAILFQPARANFLMLADRHQILQVEIRLDGQYSLSTQSNGVLAHTNHYLSLELAHCNQRFGESSHVRLARVSSLLAVDKKWRLDDFAAISRDQHDGAENSLWRHGKEYTLASWQIALPQQGTPTLSVVLANPQQREQKAVWRLDELFWRQKSGVLSP
nr:carcinine hydrolase/isopenicillin-N N-acyltransferase family protein [uncultured Deefgea sp.]